MAFRREKSSRLKAICPHAMRSFRKVAALRLTESIRIQSARRALRCFQNELHHFYHSKSEVVSDVNGTKLSGYTDVYG